MAARIRGAGFALHVFDTDGDRARRVGDDTGAHVAASPSALAEACDVVITILPTSAVVADVLNAPGGVLDGMKPGTILLDMTSGVPSETRRLADLVAARGGVLLDAPVSGGVPRARTGELAIMIGGAVAHIAAVDPVLRAMGTSIVRTGDVGSAHAMKALNNLVSAAGFLAAVEALAIGKRFGIDDGLMVDVLNASTGMNNATQKKLKQFVLSRSFGSGFGLDLMAKDLWIALNLARENDLDTPFSRTCRELWAEAAASLGPGRDHTEIARAVEARTGVRLGETSDADQK